MENNELKFYEEWEEGRLNKALINAIAFSFGQYDEHESWMKVRHAGAEIQFHQLEKHGRTNPGCVLDMGEISGALALLYAYSGYNTQILAGNIKIEKNLRLTKRKLNIESYIKLGIAKDWEHINKLNVNTVIICDLPDLVLESEETSAAGVRFIPLHDRSPLSRTHGRGAGVGQEIEKNILRPDQEEVIEGGLEYLLSLFSGSKPDRLHHFDSKGLDYCFHHSSSQSCSHAG